VLRVRKHRLVVKPHRPWKDGLTYAGAAFAVAALAWTAFEYGRWRAGYDHVAAAREQARLTAELRGAQADNAALTDRVALLARSSEIDETARAQVKGSITELQDEILELREELAFYRGIIAPDDSGGLRIQSLKLMRGAEDRHWHYRLVLIQSIKQDQRANGAVALTVHGVKGGAAVALPWSEVAATPVAPLGYSFKYFQDFEGDLLLPAGFTPGRIEVEVQPRGGGEVVHRSFEWTTVTT
jgi:hypothetical protein